VREHVSHRDSFVVSPAGPVTASRPSIARLLEPRSVAVIGASRDAANLGRRVLEGIVESGFRGNVYPVNAHADDLAGRPARA
jgi:acyl-CoA synthetase (NDP forming)